MDFCSVDMIRQFGEITVTRLIAGGRRYQITGRWLSWRQVWRLDWNLLPVANRKKNVEFLISCSPQQRRVDHQSMTDATLIPKVASVRLEASGTIQKCRKIRGLGCVNCMHARAQVTQPKPTYSPAYLYIYVHTYVHG